MTPIQNSPLILLVCAGLLTVVGLFEMGWGRRIHRQGDWLVGLAITLTLGATIFQWTQLASAPPEPWVHGWIWPRTETGAILVGLMPDPLGLVMTSLAMLVAGVLVIGRASLARPRDIHRVFAALSFSSAGLAICWLAATPWFGFLGLALSIFGGFVSLASESDSEGAATRFGWERCWGLIAALLGACVLASSRAPLAWTSPEAWSATAGSPVSNWIGASLLVAGLFIQLQPFPLLGWLVRGSETATPSRILTAQIFPALGAFALLVRLEPHLRAIGFFPFFGWIALGSTLLTIGSGLLQASWHAGLGTWLSAGYSVSLAILAFSGPWASISTFVGLSLGGGALALAAAALEQKSGDSGSTESSEKRGTWLKVAAFAGGLAGTGMIGFVPAGGMIRWLAQASDPAVVVPFATASFLVILLGWKQVWTILRIPSASPANWSALVAPFLLSVLALGLVWNGVGATDATIGAQKLIPSITGVFLGPSLDVPEDPSILFATPALIYWGAFALAMIAAYWTAGRRDSWEAVRRGLPRASAFVANGYGIDRVGESTIRAVTWTGQLAQWVVDDRIWGVWLPVGIVSAITWAAETAMRVDRRVTWTLGSGLRRSVEVPSKLLQLIQSGDVRWYLFFAVGSGLAMLAHFLRT